ncbi:hypothetical protein CC80DRAFT_561352 [Byssothecium circinans]|uniref:Uncharacterized protein n=1 Tax=Byssothecium circinans TaxID=147558 RepID=A0A6A5U1M9_9PLEO|nr:hypothetical protein CC80DRAFT_561352 [Byssothecium circinans]
MLLLIATIIRLLILFTRATNRDLSPINEAEYKLILIAVKAIAYSMCVRLQFALTHELVVKANPRALGVPYIIKYTIVNSRQPRPAFTKVGNQETKQNRVSSSP